MDSSDQCENIETFGSGSVHFEPIGSIYKLNYIICIKYLIQMQLNVGNFFINN